MYVEQSLGLALLETTSIHYLKHNNVDVDYCPPT